MPPPGRDNSLERLEIVPSGGPTGAEIKGVDLSKPISEDVAAALKQAWTDHLVLVFRDQKLEQRNYLDTVRLFGEPVANGAKHLYATLGDKSLWHAMDYDEVSMLSNLDDDGKPTVSNAGLGSLEVVWHSDNSYIETPPAGSTLYSVAIPRDDSGQTSFSNQYMAYDDLPSDLLKEIKGRWAKQDATRNSANVLKPGVKEPTCPEEVPGPFHPLVWVHPVSGKKHSILAAVAPGRHNTLKECRAMTARICWTGFGPTQRKPNTLGPINGGWVILLFGKTVVPCTDVK
jgi:taurine dioxygenase